MGFIRRRKEIRFRIIERYTRVSPDTVEYSYTVDDPLVYTSPWTAQHNLTLDNDYTLAPEICREGITAMGSHSLRLATR